MYNIAIPNLLNGVSQQPPQVRFPTQCEEMVNGYASPTESLTKRYPTEVLADFSGNGDVFGKGKLHIVDRGDGKEAYALTVKDDGITAWDLINNSSVPVQVPAGGGYTYLSGGNVDDLETDITLATIADYTFVCNRNKTIAMTSQTIAQRNSEALVWVKTGNYGTDYTVDLKIVNPDGSDSGLALDSISITHKTFTPGTTNVDADGYVGTGGVTIDGETFAEGSSVLDTRLIAAQLKVAIETAVSTAAGTSTIWNDVDVTRKDYGIYITLDRASSGYDYKIRVSTADGLSGNGVLAVGEETQVYEDLPIIAQDGMITKVVGIPEVSEDDYYLRFSANLTGSLGEGIWVETVAPGIPYRLDPLTMPHALIRKFDVQGDPYFVFTPMDGSADAGEVFWDDRTVGDELSNPDPSFVGAEISSIFAYQGRLGILSGEAVSVSEAGNFFNFFRTTVTTVLDSDPIDVYSAYPQITKFRHGISLGERLILFSNKAQMVLTSPDTELLTPKTVILEPAGQYEAFADCAPAQVDQEIYFPFKRGGNYTGVRDMVVNLSDASLIAAPEVTAHVPKYIRGTPKSMKVSPFDRTLVVLTDDDPSSLYVYKWFDRDNERIQSSWSRWTFGGVSVISIGWYESRLILHTFNTESQTYGLREIDFRENRVDTDSFITTRLDNRRYFGDTSSGSIVVPGVLSTGVQQTSVLFRFGTVGSTSSIFMPGEIPETVVNPGETEVLPTFVGPDTQTSFPTLSPEILEADYIHTYAVPVKPGVKTDSLLQFSATRPSPAAPGNRQFSLRLLTNEGSYLINTNDLRFSPIVVSNSYSSGSRADFFVGSYQFGLEYSFSWGEPSTADPSTGVAVWSLNCGVTLSVLDGPDSTIAASVGFLTGCTTPVVAPTTFQPDSCSTRVVYTNNTSQPILVGGNAQAQTPLIPGDTVVYASGTNAGRQVEEVSRTYNEVSGTTQIFLNTDGSPVFHGNPYEFRYTFSQPYFRVGTGGSALGAGRFQVRDMQVNYDESGPFRAEVSSANPLINSSYTYHRGSTVNSSFVNSPLESGTMRIPVMGTTEQFNVSLINDTPYPSKFTSAEVQATYSGRYRRI